MFVDLVKARKRKSDDDEVSQERIRELMDEMFKGVEDDDLIASDRELDDDELDALDKRIGYGAERNELRKELEDADDDLDKRYDYTKGMRRGKGAARNELNNLAAIQRMFKGDDERRELMDQVFSLVDDLSDEELKSIIESRAMRKAMAMQIFNQMPTSELADFVSQQAANGEGATENLAKGDDLDDMDDDLDDEELAKGDDLDDEELAKGDDNDDLEGDDMGDDLEGDDDDDLEG